MSEMKPRYFCALSAGITASPGASIAGTTSPAPFGPGTERTPDLYPCGFPPPALVLPTAPDAVSLAPAIAASL